MDMVGREAGMISQNPWHPHPIGILIPHRALREMIRQAVTAAVFRVFRAVTVTPVVVSSPLGSTVTGGPLPSPQRHKPGSGACTTAAPSSTGTSSTRITVSVFGVSGIRCAQRLIQGAKAHCAKYLDLRTINEMVELCNPPL